MAVLMRWLLMGALVGASACVYDDECVDGYVEGADGACVPRGGPADGGPLDGGSGDGGPTDGAPPTDEGMPDSFVPAPGQLLGLELEVGALDAPFDPDTTSYTAFVGILNDDVRLRPTAPAGSTIEVEGMAVASGALSGPIDLTGVGTVFVDVVATSGDGASMTYTVEIVRGDITYFKHESPSPGDAYGWSVSLDGDTLVVGILSDDSPSAAEPEGSGLTDSGAVYVYRRSAAGWAQEAYLKASNAAMGDQFGHSVAVSGDLLAVGSNARDSAAGGVYVFRRTGSSWSELQILAHPFPEAFDRFGEELALDGDALLVGCRLDDSGTSAEVSATAESNAGAVFAYRLNGAGTFMANGVLKPHNPGMDDEFGTRLDLFGDLAVVGAPYEDTNAEGVRGDDVDNDDLGNSGAAYVFRYTAGAWQQVAFLKAVDPDLNDDFGRDVAITDRFVAVGAPFERSNARGVGGDSMNDDLQKAGAVYVYRWSSGNLLAPVYIKSFNGDVDDEFGRDLDLDGDLLVVGAYREASNATGLDGAATDNSIVSAGAAYEFRFTGSTWTEGSYIKPLYTAMDFQFGRAIAISRGVAAISARGDGTNATGVDGTPDGAVGRSGAVYMY